LLKFNRLTSGGIITNYYCSSKCRHCVYASSPEWPKEYMTEEMAYEVFQKIRQMRCSSVHIGGGEPLLNPEGLFPVLKCAMEQGTSIEYIETNASWHKDMDKTCKLLRELQCYNINTLLISMDPFHNEYIPFSKVKGLINTCEQTGMSVFPWLVEFFDDIDEMDDSKTHQLEEYEKHFGTGYIRNLMTRYRLNLRGRALKTYKKYLRHYAVHEILQDSGPCMELSGVYHFHIDLYGNYIPQSCAGLSININDLAEGVSPDKYPVINALYSKGIKGLFDIAVKNHGLIPHETYAGKCDLCHDIRRYLALDLKLDLPDLKPVGHYLHI
jgi:hypothetical protein